MLKNYIGRNWQKPVSASRDTLRQTDRQTDVDRQTHIRGLETHISALEVIFNEMRYINLRFTYLLTYLLTCTDSD